MRSSTEASLVAWNLFERGILQGFDDVKLLGLWTAEPSNLFTKSGVKSYNDIKGLKIRSVGRLEGDFLKKTLGINSITRVLGKEVLLFV